MRTQKLIITAFAVIALGTTGLLAATPIGQQVVKVTKTPGNSFKVSSASSTVLNEVSPQPSYSERKLYTNDEMEQSILSVRTAAFALHSQVVDMFAKKQNQVKDDVQNHDLGADKDTRDILKIINEMLATDKGIHSEHDKIALAALENEVTTLNDRLDKIQRTIPIADSGYALPTDSDISVMGTSQIQAYPLLDGDTVIGHYRVACSGALKEDVIVNQTSVNYCVASLYVNGSPRVTDASNGRTETIDMFYIGVTDSYVAGKDAVAHIRWMDHPKTSVMGTLKYYNLDTIPNVVDALTWNSTITLSNGTKYPGKNAMVEK